MSPKSFPLALMFLVLALALTGANAQDMRIPLPKRTKPTPVQQLNRDGVKAIEKHQYEKAKKLFFKAYLLDPNDPFTLNNLGYISELEGDVDRAQRYYDLAQQEPSDAIVDKSNNRDNEGKPVAKVAGNTGDVRLQINRMNIAAIGLLRKDRAPEADTLLQKALALDAKNPFTLNNMGYAKEKEGELESALNYYNAAAALGSHEAIVVTVNKNWRGKPISSVAEGNAAKLRSEMKKVQTPEARVARLNLQGVSAMNRNDRRAARAYFEQAYKLDPSDAFALNNMGYLSEMDGDRETAELYYDKARQARRNRAQVTVATRREVEGQRVGDVATNTDQKVQAQMEAAAEAKRRLGGPILLKRRDNTAVVEPISAPPPISNQAPVSAAPAAAPATTAEPQEYEIPDHNNATPNVPRAIGVPSQPPPISRPPQ